MTNPYITNQSMELFYPNAIYAPADGLMARWREIVVPIFVDSKKSEHALNGVGSAFVAECYGRKFLITALHVIKDANKHQIQIANICGKGVDLGGLVFKKSSKQDVAITEMTDQWLINNGVETIKAMPILRNHAQYVRTGACLLLGYPGSKNQIDQRYGRVDRLCHSITVEYAHGGRVKTEIETPVLLSYDPKNLVDSNREKHGPPVDLKGMSGGPCFEILFERKDAITEHYSIDLVGVISEWHRANRIVVVSPISTVYRAIYEFASGTQ